MARDCVTNGESAREQRSTDARCERHLTYLLKFGPTATDTFAESVHTRQIPARLFNPKGKPGSYTSSVVYLPDHSKRAVVREYVEKNEKVIENNSMQAMSMLMREQGSCWKEAWDNIKYDYYR